MTSVPGNQPKRKGIAPWKIVVGVLLACVALLGLVIVAGVVFIGLNRDSLKQEASLEKERGATFGKTHTQRECVFEALAGLDTADFAQKVMGRMFLEECLSVAQPSAGLCLGAPADSQIIASATWQLQTCMEYGKPDDADCARLMGKVQDFCHPKPSRTNPTNPKPPE